MNSGRLLYQDEAARAVEGNISPRHARLDRLERYVIGTQYDGRPSFFDDSVPLLDRAPCIVYPIVQSAIRSTVDLCLGEGRWPLISARVSDDTGVDARFALPQDAVDSLSSLLSQVVEQARLKCTLRDALEAAMGCGTAVLVGCVKRGRLAVDIVPAKWCRPTFDDSTGDVSTLEIRYPYVEEYLDTREGKWACRSLLYRRVIDSERDTTYLPERAREDGQEPTEWRTDPSKTVVHGLGFAPVVWYAYARSISTVADHDGRSVHAELLDEIDCLNYALSQRHASAMVAASPPTIEIGVDEDHNPAPDGRMPRMVISSPFGGGWVEPGSQRARAARKRGPGTVWRYPSPDSKVDMLTMGGDALKPIDDAARDLRSKIAEALSVVFVDPDSAKFSAELSGKAIARLYDRQIRLCDKVRLDFGDGCLLPVVSLLLRIALRVESAAPGSLYIDGLASSIGVLGLFERPMSTGGVAWFPPPLELAWGPYFAPDPSDELEIVQSTIKAHEAGLITKRTAVEELTDVFSIGDVDAYVDELDREAEERSERQREDMSAALAMTHGSTDEDSEAASRVDQGAPSRTGRDDAPRGQATSAAAGRGPGRGQARQR